MTFCQDGARVARVSRKRARRAAGGGLGAVGGGGGGGGGGRRWVVSGREVGGWRRGLCFEGAGRGGVCGGLLALASMLELLWPGV